MKQEPGYRFCILFCVLLTISGFAGGSVLSENISNQSVSGNLTNPVLVSHVSTVISNPSHYVGNQIILNAMVSKAYPLQHQFTIADQVGCSLCTAKNALNSMTVWYQGKIPKVWETVQVSGQVIHDERSGYVINASSVKI
jgi:hypothetical protein